MGFSSEKSEVDATALRGMRSAAALCQDTVQRHLPPEATTGSDERSCIPRGHRGTDALEEPERGSGRSRSAAAEPAPPQPPLQPAPCVHGGEAAMPAKLPDPSEGAGCSALAVNLQLGWRF